jgi:hypothetical protein
MQGINFKQNIWPVLRRPVSFHKFDNSQLSLFGQISQNWLWTFVLGQNF